MTIRVLIFVLCTFLSGNNCFASDEKREADFAEGINKTLGIGKAVWLVANEKNFWPCILNPKKLPVRGSQLFSMI